MDTLQIVAMLVVFISLMLFVYYFFNNNNNGIITDINDAIYYKYIDADEFGIPEGLKSKFATSIWVYVNNWEPTTKDKIIYYIGHNTIGNDAGATTTTVTTHGLFENLMSNADVDIGMVVMGLDQNDATLKIDIATDGASEPTFTINDFPLQAWVNVTLSVYNDSIDLYINGKLVSSKYVDNLIIRFPSGGNRLVSLGNPWNVFNSESNDKKYTNLTGGFMGYTSKFKFFNNSLTPNEAYDIYKSGPGGSSLVNMLGNRGLDINFMDGQDITSTYKL